MQERIVYRLLWTSQKKTGRINQILRLRFCEEEFPLRAIQNWLDRFCHKHPKLAIPNLMLYLVLGTALIALLDAFSMGNVRFSSFFSFNASAILHGQVWRIFTFLFVPTGNSLFTIALSLYFYYFVGSVLEREWGSAKFTIYYFFGILLNIVLGFMLGGTHMFYVNMALFFAFATLFPDMQVLLFFIIPVKIKWLAWFDAAFFAFQILGSLFGGSPTMALIPIVAILNYLLFFGGDLLDFIRKGKTRVSYQHNRNRKTVDFHSAQQHAREKKGYLHKCAVCGRTDVTNPELEFRYCSKCKGYYCYCSEHINSHVHIE